MNMRAKEPVSHSAITMHMRCSIPSAMQKMSIIIERESGIRLSTAGWQWIFHGRIQRKNMSSCMTECKKIQII